MNNTHFQMGKYQLPLSSPHIMGILNITEDSFYDGGRWLDKHAALGHAEQMAEEGACIIDIGGESTRPGAKQVGSEEEISRTLEIIATLSQRLDIPISVDTSNPKLIQLAASAGCSLINDVRALTNPDVMSAVSAMSAAAAAQSGGLPVCLMHIQGTPSTMQHNPTYENVVEEVKDYLKQRKQQAIANGIAANQIILDPGFGFGKNFEHNRLLMSNLDSFKDLGCPLLVGLSRKEFLGKITGKEPEQRLWATIASTALLVERGAWIVRVHDVAANVDAMKLAVAMIEN